MNFSEMTIEELRSALGDVVETRMEEGAFFEGAEIEKALRAEIAVREAQVVAEARVVEENARPELEKKAFVERYGAALAEADRLDAERVAQFDADNLAKVEREIEGHHHGIR